MSVRDFYDGLARDYHLVYGDWLAAVDQQGAALDRLIRSLHPSSVDVLDCSCGIGTQALGLARLGYKVHATDISEQSLHRARREATRLGVDVAFEVCDFRDLTPLAGVFDVVISCDNAIPHLLTDEDLLQAFQAMRSKLRNGGLLLASLRDYDRTLVDRPVTAIPQIDEGPPRRVLVRLHDWDAPDSPMYTVRLLILTETPTGWTVTHHHTRYRALTRETVTRVAEKVGFTDVTWHSSDDVGFHQPIVTAFQSA